MKSVVIQSLALAVVLSLLGAGPAFAAEDTQQDATSVFLGSPLLVLGILAGAVAVAFALYSWRQMSGGALGSVYLLLGLALLSFDAGVIAVTFFEMGDTTVLIHDIALLLGFVLAMVATNRMRSVFS